MTCSLGGHRPPLQFYSYRSAVRWKSCHHFRGAGVGVGVGVAAAALGFSFGVVAGGTPCTRTGVPSSAMLKNNSAFTSGMRTQPCEAGYPGR